MPSVFRILDANFNRAREALRVMEDASRFILNNAELTQAIKSMRHDLAGAMASLATLALDRDTPGDVGTTIKADGEMSRGSVADAALAAGKRLSEALRAIEEYGKIPDVASGFSPAAIEQLRYRGYELERRLNTALVGGRARQWRLCVLLGEDLCPRGDWLAVAQVAIDAGADCLQLREKRLDAGQLLCRARELVAITRPRGVSLIINDRPDVALLAGADGVHLGQTDLPCRETRRLVGRQLIIGVSTSRMEQAKQALEDGADYCGVGPMFASTTKSKDFIAGCAYLREYLAWAGLPHLAIGGITPANIGPLVAAGVRGVAVSSAVCAAPNPAAAARQLLAALEK